MRSCKIKPRNQIVIAVLLILHIIVTSQLVKSQPVSELYSTFSNALKSVSDLYDQRGYLAANVVSVDGNLIVNKLNRNLQYAYPLSEFQLNGHKFDLTLSYNQNATYTSFLWNQVMGGDRKWITLTQNRPAWIIGINGFALQAFTNAERHISREAFRTNPCSVAKKKTTTCPTPSNVFTDEDFVWLLDGYGYCTGMQKISGQMSTQQNIIQDEIRLLRTDGSVMVLTKVTDKGVDMDVSYDDSLLAEIVTGTYVEAKVNSNAYAVVTTDQNLLDPILKEKMRQMLGSDNIPAHWIPRWVHYYTGDGLEYIFREWVTPYGQEPFFMEDMFSVEWALTIMQPQRSLNQDGGDTECGPSIFYLDRIEQNGTLLLKFDWASHNPAHMYSGNPLSIPQSRDNSRGHAQLNGFDGHRFIYTGSGLIVNAGGKQTEINYREGLYSGLESAHELYSRYNLPFNGIDDVVWWSETQFCSWTGLVKSITDAVGRITNFTYEPYQRKYKKTQFPIECDLVHNCTGLELNNKKLIEIIEPARKIEIDYEDPIDGTGYDAVDGYFDATSFATNQNDPSQPANRSLAKQVRYYDTRSDILQVTEKYIPGLWYLESPTSILTSNAAYERIDELHQNNQIHNSFQEYFNYRTVWLQGFNQIGITNIISTEVLSHTIERDNIAEVTQTAYESVGGTLFTDGPVSNMRLPQTIETFTVDKNIAPNNQLMQTRSEFTYQMSPELLLKYDGANTGTQNATKNIWEWMYGRTIASRLETKQVYDGTQWNDVLRIKNEFLHKVAGQCSTVTVQGQYDKIASLQALYQYAQDNGWTPEQTQYAWEHAVGDESWYKGLAPYDVEVCSYPLFNLPKSATVYDASGTNILSKSENTFDEIALVVDGGHYVSNPSFGKVLSTKQYCEGLARYTETVTQHTNTAGLSGWQFSAPTSVIGPDGATSNFIFNPGTYPSYVTDGSLQSKVLRRGYDAATTLYDIENIDLTDFTQRYFEKPRISSAMVRAYTINGGMIDTTTREIRTAASYGWFGQVTESVDANGYLTAYEYDDIGRLTRAWMPGDFSRLSETAPWPQYSLFKHSSRLSALGWSVKDGTKLMVNCVGNCDQSPTVDPNWVPPSYPLGEFVPGVTVAYHIETDPMCPCYTPPDGTQSISKGSEVVHITANTPVPYLYEGDYTVDWHGSIGFNRGENYDVTEAKLKLRPLGVGGINVPVRIVVKDQDDVTILDEALYFNSFEADPNYEESEQALVFDMSGAIAKLESQNGVSGADPASWSVHISSEYMEYEGSVHFEDVWLDLSGTFRLVDSRNEYDFTLAFAYNDNPNSSTLAIDGGMPSSIMYAKLDDQYMTSDQETFLPEDYNSRHVKSMSLFGFENRLIERHWNYAQADHALANTPPIGSISTMNLGHSGFGQVITTTDPTGYISNTKFNEQGIAIETKRGDASLGWSECNVNAVPTSAESTAVTLRAVDYGLPTDTRFGLPSTVLALFDGYCRRETVTISTTSPVTTATFFDARGRKVASVENYLSTTLSDDLTDPLTISNDLNKDRNLATIYGYDNRDRVIWVINPKRQVTQYWYDDFGRIRYVYQPDQGFTSFAYDNMNRVRYSQAQQQANEGKVTFIEYDDLGRTTLTGEAHIDITTFPPPLGPPAMLGGPYFDPMSMVAGPLGTTMYPTNPPSAVFTRFTDKLDARVIANGVVLDSTRNRTLLEVPVRVVPNLYAAHNHHTDVPCANLVVMASSERFNPPLSPNGDQALVEHTTINWLETIQPLASAVNFEDIADYPENALRAVWYDEFPPIQGTAFGALPPKARWDALAPNTSGVRNLVGRPSVVAYRTHHGQPFHYMVMSYDERGRVEALLRYTENVGFDATYYSYNSMNKPIAVHAVDPTGQHGTWYGYDASGRVSKVWTAQNNNAGLGYSNAPTYPGANLAAKPENPEVEYTYDARDAVAQVSYPVVGMTTTYTYNEAGQQKRALSELTTGNQVIYDQRLSYNNRGLITQQCSNTDEYRKDAYIYDDVNRLQTWFRGMGGDPPGEGYLYDQIGNRIQQLNYENGIVTSDNTYTHGTQNVFMAGSNWLNEVTSANSNDDLTYNANGAMILRERRKTDPFAASHRIEEYFWDPFGLVKRFRMREESVQGAITAGCEADATNAPANEWCYRFNPLNEREQKRQVVSDVGINNSGLAWTYTQIGIDKKPLTDFHGIQGAFCNEPPTTISLWPVARHAYGPRGVHIISRPLGGREYVVSDHLGSVRAVVSDMSAILERKDYKPFGSALTTAGTGARTGYIDREEDGESGLGSYGVRLYEPEYGRFTSVDVMWEEYLSTNPYLYAQNNCTSLFDPSGLIVEFADDDFRAEHAILYNAKDADGNFINTDYRCRYDKLHSSDITYRVRSIGVLNSDEMSDERSGTLTTDGQIVFIDIDKTKDGTYAREGTHELVHAEQFEDGKLGFAFQNGEWLPYNNSLTLEYEAYEKQSVPHPEFTGMEWVREMYSDLPDSSDRFIDPSLISRYVNRTPSYFDVWYPR